MFQTRAVCFKQGLIDSASLRVGSLVSTFTGIRDGEKNGATKSEPARELLNFEFPAFADGRSDLIG